MKKPGGGVGTGGHICSISREGVEYLIDAEDYARLPGSVYANNDPVGYLRIDSEPLGRPLLHRWILGVTDARLVDHINRNHLDNRRSNLRIVDATQSNYNRRAWNKAGLPPGVRRLATGYSVVVQYKGKRYNLGIYDTPERAADIRAKFLEGVI